MKFWVIIAASLYTPDGSSFDLEDVHTFSPVQGNNVNFVYESESKCEAGLFGIQQREGGRLFTSEAGSIRYIKNEGSNFPKVYDCTEVVVSK